MKLEIALIRHGQRQNRDARLVGATDGPLGEAGDREIREKAGAGRYPEAELVFSSGLARCVETARIIYPSVPVILMKELRAPDYGDFDGKSLSELANDKAFTQWAASSSEKVYPNAEEPAAISARSVAAFRQIASEMAGKGLKRASIVSHKMIFHAILQRIQVPRSNYSMYNIPHGGGCILTYDTALASAKVMGEF